MAKTNRSSKKSTHVAKTDTVQINMSASVEPAAGDEGAALSELLATLGVPAPDEVIEPTAEVAIPESEVAETVDAGAAAIDAGIIEAETLVVEATTEVPVTSTDSLAELAEVVSGVEALDAMIASAEVHTPDGTITGGDSDVPANEPAAEKPAATSKPRPVRQHYANRVARMQAVMGEALPEFTVLTLDDAATIEDDASVAALVERTMGLIAGMNKKKQNRASFLLEFVAGKKDTLNAIILRALLVLQRDGHLTTGGEGNYLKDLLGAGYTPATARAAGGNSVSMLEDLKLIQQAEKGKFVANPDSLLLAKVYERLSEVEVEGAGEPAATTA